MDCATPDRRSGDLSDDTHPGLVEREGRGVLNRAPTYATWCDGFRHELNEVVSAIGRIRPAVFA
jgi:hypothetical protein